MNTWKQLLKKRLYYSKKYKDPFLILDYNIYNPLLELTESNNNFDIESFLVALSLQGREKLTGFQKYYNRDYIFMSSSYFQEILIVTDKILVVIQKYPENIIRLLFQQDDKVVCDEFFHKKVYYTKNTIVFPNGFKLKMNKHSLEFNNQVFNINFLPYRLGDSYEDLQFRFDDSFCTVIHEIEGGGFFEKNFFDYNTGILEALAYNLTYVIKKPEIKIKVIGILQLEKSQFRIFNEEKIENLLEIRKILNNDELLKINYQNNIYYLQQVSEKVYYINKFEPIYIYNCNVVNENGTKYYGKAWIKILNDYTEKQIVQKKLNFLFKPLERPPIENFVNDKIPLEGVVPSILVLVFFIVSIILIIVLCCLILLPLELSLPIPQIPL